MFLVHKKHCETLTTLYSVPALDVIANGGQHPWTVFMKIKLLGKLNFSAVSGNAIFDDQAGDLGTGEENAKNTLLCHIDIVFNHFLFLKHRYKLKIKTRSNANLYT